MKNLLIVMLALTAMLLWGACASIQIVSPTDGQVNVPSPYNLKVEHVGCGTVEQSTFKAWLDKGTRNEKEITTAFSYQAGSWTAKNYNLPAGNHSLTATADIDPGSGSCRVTSEKDTHKFTVESSAPPAMEVTPSSCSFGEVKVGNTSKPCFVTIKNNGTQALVVKIAPIADLNFGFNVGTCQMVTPIIKPGSSCRVNPYFKPIRTGSQQGELIIIGDNLPGKPRKTVTLSGTGIN